MESLLEKDSIVSTITKGTKDTELKIARVLGTLESQCLIEFIHKEFDRFSFYIQDKKLYVIDKTYQEIYILGEIYEEIRGDFIIKIIEPGIDIIRYDIDYYGNIVYNTNETYDSFVIEKRNYGVRVLYNF